MRWICLHFALLCLVFGGCGKEGIQKYRVRGQVSWKGVPVEKGQIIFLPVDSLKHAEGGAIADGKFEVWMESGQRKVQVFASRALPDSFDPVMNAPLLERYIPPQFNDRTTLKTEIQPHNNNVVTFDLAPPTARRTLTSMERDR